jgi:hypothetical protein
VRSLRDLERGQELECLGSRSLRGAKVFLRGEVVGRLTGKPEGFKSADGSWTIKTRSGFLRFTQIVTERAHDVEVALPVAIQGWSLTSLQQRLFKTGGRLIRHARYFALQLAESYLTGSLFRQILQRIERLAWHPT